MRNAQGSNESITISIIVPFFNEEQNLPLFTQKLEKVLETLTYNWEVLLIDNCSTDQSSNFARNLAKSDFRIKYIRFSRNFGPTVEASISAGYRLCQGDAAIVIYSDLQDPPELICAFIEKWDEGYDVVYGLQTIRLGEPRWRKFLVKLFYRFLDKMSDTNPIPANAGDFRLISRNVIEIVNQLPERSRYTRGLIAWAGYKSIGVEYERRPRELGESNTNLFSIMALALTAVTSFSLKPLRLLTGFGLSVTLLSALMSIFYLILFFTGEPVPGLTTVILISLFSLGLNMGALGLLGEYIGRISIETKQRPLYVINERIN
jgi:polyisoprenyl-phosphate glycosyltransferase